MCLGGTTTLIGEPVRRVLAAGCLVLLACSPAPRWIAVADGRGASLLLFRPDLTSADTVRLAHLSAPFAESHRLQFSNGGGAALIGFREEEGAETVVRVRLGDGDVLGRWPPGLRQVPHVWTYLPHSRILVGVGADSMSAPRPTGYVSVVVPDRDWSERHLPLCAGTPTGMAPFDRGERIFVACDSDPGIIAEIDPTGLRVVRTSTTGLAGCRPNRLAFSRNEGILFVLCQGSGQLLFLDRVNLLPIDSIDVGLGVTDFLIVPWNPEAILTVPDRLELVVLNLRDQSIVARIKTAESPRHGTITHGVRAAYFTTQNDGAENGSLVRIDLKRHQIVASARIPAGGHAVAAWPGARSPRMDWR